MWRECRAGDNQAAILATPDGLASVVGVLRGSVRSPHVHQAACLALWNISCNNGGCGSCSFTEMRCFVAHGLHGNALVVLSCTEAAQRTVAELDGAVVAIVASMGSNGRHAGLQEAACGAIQSLACNGGCARPELRRVASQGLTFART